LVKTLKHSPIFPEYPATDDAGFAYLINVQGFSEEEIKTAHQSVPVRKRRYLIVGCTKSREGNRHDVCKKQGNQGEGAGSRRARVTEQDVKEPGQDDRTCKGTTVQSGSCMQA
jgi:hypothetical protein